MQSEQPEWVVYQRARFTARLPTAYLYTPGHFWIGRQEDDIWRVGLTKFGSRMLGEMVDYGFDVTPNTPVASGQAIGWVEGFKALSDLFCIAEGDFLGSNPALERHLTLVNQDPHGAGWLYAVRGHPDSTCVDVKGYAGILDQTIDRLLHKE